MKATLKNAVEAVNRAHALLVYPLDNRPEPASLWSSFYPKSEMRWEWDQEGDDRVADLWRLRENLSRSGKVVYAKWFRGRATFFSREVFVDLLAAYGTSRNPARALGFGEDAKRILETLEMDSPLSTKQLKAATDLRGKLYERAYERAMKSLWNRLAIVGFGEIDDGAFPSLAVGATKNLFEDLWQESREVDPATARDRVADRLGETSLFYRHFLKTLGCDSPGVGRGSRHDDSDRSDP
jgi:hypothetical protein